MKKYKEYWINNQNNNTPTTGSTGNALRERNHLFYLSKRWRQTRLIILNENPICTVCNVEPAFHVHHIIPLHSVNGWSNRLNLDHLISICIGCHSKETQREQRELKYGKTTDRMNDLNNFD